jgi:hypothetical protein
MKMDDAETVGDPIPVEPFSSAPDDVVNSRTEDQTLALLNNRDLSPHEVELIVKTAPMKSRKVRLAIATHPHAPRAIALRLIHEFYTFELMQFSLAPTPAPDLKRVADELLVARLPSVTLGERISLARRSSALVAAALLSDREARVWQTALENPRVSEAAIVKALQRPLSSPAFVEAVCHDPKWSLRPEIRIALLRSAHTPMARAIEFARRLPPPLLRDVLHASRLPEKIKEHLRKELL